MCLLAEISDKVATISEMWLKLGLFSILLSMPGLIHHRVAYLLFAVGLFVSVVLAYSSYHDVFTSPFFSQAVQEEMGSLWIAHYLVSSFCPAFFTGMVLMWHLKKRTSTPKSA